MEAYPAMSRLAPFMGTGHQNYKMLKQFLWGRFVTFDKLAGGRPPNAAVASAALLLEAFLVDCPVLWITRAMQKLPRRHRSNYTNALRKLAK